MHYQPVTRTDRLLSLFGVERLSDEPPIDVFPLGLAPFIRLAPNGREAPSRVAEDGIFGLLPHFATELAFGRRTYNARTETVAQLPSFKQAWRRAQRCVIPAEAIYEPNWDTGKAVRWRIGQPGDVPMGIAGIYTQWRHADGRNLFTFAMLTVNADDHPVMHRFHRPGDEKRMVVILDANHYDAWLTASVDDARRYLKQWTGALLATPAPLLPRAPRADSGRIIVPPTAGDLFS